MTLQTQLVLRLLLTDPSKEWYSLAVGQESGLANGTVHPILARLESAGWLESRWEQVDPREEKRPRRRYYRLTGEGVVEARRALARAQASKSSPKVKAFLLPGLADGLR
jgi:DNA-binding PadR family transcriptional regulator